MKNQRASLTLVLVGLLAVVLAIGAYYLLYAPTLDARAEADSAAEEAETANQAAETELKNLAEQAKHLDESKAQLETKRAQFPTNLELASFTAYLSDLVTGTEATLVNLSHDSPAEVTMAQPLPPGPGGEKPPVVPQPPPGLYQYRFNISINGRLDQTQAFLRALQEDDARMFLVTSVSLVASDGSSTSGDDETAQYTIQGYTYALVPADEIPTQVQDGGNSG
ncbi:MAG: hypothetical protein LBK95_13000 [Bifidobacteriaceae bacterium]|jgi:hypothetical protein|nr:hypothetical protein [Bifidobacteriaceae bacterium]